MSRARWLAAAVAAACLLTPGVAAAAVNGANFTPHALTLSATTGVPFEPVGINGNPVGNFSAIPLPFDDSPMTNPCLCFTAFKVTIDWGDGTPTSTGRVGVGTSDFPSDGRNSYNVLGSHTYAAAGTYGVSMKVERVVDGVADPANSGTVESTIAVTGYEKPTVSLTPATSIGRTTATLNGVANAKGPAATRVTMRIAPMYGLLPNMSSLDTTKYTSAQIPFWVAVNISREATTVDIPAGTGAVNVPITAPVTGLFPNTRYAVTMTATSTSPSGPQTVTTPAGAAAIVTTQGTPVATTDDNEPLAVTDSGFPTGRTVRATVDAGGTPTDAVIEYGKTTAYGLTAGAQRLERQPSDVFVGDCITGLCAHFPASLFPQQLTVALPGPNKAALEPNTTYHYRVAATNQTVDPYGPITSNVARGADRTFVTGAEPEVTVSKPAVAGVTAGTVKVRLSGTLRQFGTDAHVSWEWGVATGDSPTRFEFNDGTAQYGGQPFKNQTADTPISTTVEVSARVPYVFRAVVSRTGGSSRPSPEVTNCASAKPRDCVKTRGASVLLPIANVTKTGAHLAGYVMNPSNRVINPSGHGMPGDFNWCEALSNGLCVNPNEQPDGTSRGFNPSVLNDDIALMKVESDMTDLLPSRRYKAWITLHTDIGDVKSNEVFMDAEVANITATAEPATQIGRRAMTLNATVPVAYRNMSVGFVWGPGPGGKDVEIAPQALAFNRKDITTPQRVSARITGLTPGTKYHFHPVIKSAQGRIFPTDDTFAQTTGAENPARVIAGCKRSATAGVAKLFLPTGTPDSVCFTTDSLGINTVLPAGQPVYVNGVLLTPNAGVQVSVNNSVLQTKGGDGKASILIPCDACFSVASGGGSLMFPAQKISWAAFAQTAVTTEMLRLDPSLAASAMNQTMLTGDRTSAMAGFPLTGAFIVLRAGGVAETGVIAKVPLFDITTAPAVGIVFSSSDGDATWDKTLTLKDSLDLNPGGLGILRVNPFSMSYTSSANPARDDTWFSSTNLDLLLFNLDGSATFQGGQLTGLAGRVDASAQQPVSGFVNLVKAAFKSSDRLLKFGIPIAPDVWLVQIDVGFSHPRPYDFNGIDPGSCPGSAQLNDIILSSADLAGNAAITVDPGGKIPYNNATCTGKRLHVAPPVVGRGSASFAVGPIVNDMPLSNVSGTLSYRGPERDDLRDAGWGFRISGVVNVGGGSISLAKPATVNPASAPLLTGNPTTGTAPLEYNPVSGSAGSGFMEYVNGDHIAFGGGLSKTYGKDFISIAADGQGLIQTANLQSGLNLTTPSLALTLFGRICVTIPIVLANGCAAAGAGVSNTGLGACVTFAVPGLEPLWSRQDYTVGAAILFASGNVNYISNCTHEGLRAALGFTNTAFRATLGGSSGFDIPITSKLPSELIQLKGSGAPPVVRVSGPDDRTIVTDQPGFADARLMYYKNPDDNTTWIEIPDPAKGKYRIEPQPQSSPIVSVKTADGVPAPSVKATVTGTGHQRYIDYDIAAQDDQTVRFVEQGEGDADQILGEVKHGGRGRLAFFPADGKAGKRKIQALVMSQGIQVAAFDVTTYTAPDRFRPARPKLTARVRGDRLRVSWLPVSRATSYKLRVSFGKTVVEKPFGAQRHRRTTTLPMAPGQIARVRVVAADRALHTGLAATAIVSNRLCTKARLKAAKGKQATALKARCK
jgi:hypothetical protein